MGGSSPSAPPGYATATNDRYNESIAYPAYVVLVRNCSFFNLGFTRTKVSNNNDDHVSVRHHHVMQFLDASKNCRVT